MEDAIGHARIVFTRRDICDFRYFMNPPLTPLEKCVWPDGPVCKWCGEQDRINRLKSPEGRWKCYRCRKQFTALNRRHLKPEQLLAAYRLRESDEQASTTEIQKALGSTFKTAA